MRWGGIFSKGRTGRKAFVKRRLFDCGPVFEARHERGVILSGVIGNSFHREGEMSTGTQWLFPLQSLYAKLVCRSLTFLYVPYAYV
jgi:hypothetical protein